MMRNIGSTLQFSRLNFAYAKWMLHVCKYGKYLVEKKLRAKTSLYCDKWLPKTFNRLKTCKTCACNNLAKFTRHFAIFFSFFAARNFWKMSERLHYLRLKSFTGGESDVVIQRCNCVHTWPECNGFLADCRQRRV